MNWTNDDTDGYKSRSQKKRESTAAQDLGVMLRSLAESELRELDVPEALIQAVGDWKKFPGHEAKRRQMQYIGRLMRELNVEALRERLEAHLAPSREETRALHTLENLRERLVGADEQNLEKELADLAETYPAISTAHVRHLALAARTEKEKKRPPKAFRELFRYLKDITKPGT